MKKSIVIGDEYNTELIVSLANAIRVLGGEKIREDSWLGGSQDVVVQEYMIFGELLVVEVETYVGICLSGSSNVVDLVVSNLSCAEKPSEG